MADKDPFDLDDSINSHPDPLNNVVVERQPFGDVKFGVPSSSNSSSTPKYMKTEQNAKEILASASSGTPKTPKGRTPKRRGTSARTTKSTSRSAAKKFPSPDEEDPAEDEQVEASEPKAVSTPAAGRKRQGSSVSSTPATTKRSRRNEPPPPVLSAEEQVNVDHPEDPMKVPVGGRVYALWEKLYYPGIVVSFDGLKYLVCFTEDKQYKTLTDAGIIPIRDVTPTIQVDAIEGEKVVTVEIESVPNRDNAEEWLAGVFTAYSDADKQNLISIPWDKISFDFDQAKPIEGQDGSFAKYRTGKAVAASKQSRSRRSGVYYERTQTASTDSATPVTKEKKSEKKRPEKKQLFLNKQFVLTSATRTSADVQTFNKREMKRSIINQGGIVLEDLLSADSSLELYLIADTHYRTFKYLNALALSVPCVSFNWLKDCFAKNEFLDRQPYMLPSGINMLTNEKVDWHPNEGLLKDKKVFLCGSEGNIVKSEMKQFTEIWTPMVERLEGTVLKDFPDNNEDVDFVITDGVNSDEIIERTKERGIPLLSSEWIIQSIIVGELLEPNEGLHHLQH